MPSLSLMGDSLAGEELGTSSLILGWVKSEVFGQPGVLVDGWRFRAGAQDRLRLEIKI